MLSSTPMSPDAFYEAFLSILQVHGFVAVPAGDIIKIMPDANARQMPGQTICPIRVNATSDEIVTQVIAVQQRERRAARAGAASADAAVRPPGGLSRRPTS